MEEFLMRIGDRWAAASSGDWIESENPYTGKPWARIPRGTPKDADAAIVAAHAAFTTGPWSRTSPADRGLLLHKLADLMLANAEELAELEVRDTGKLKAEMLGNMRYLPRWYQYYGGLADKVEGAVSPIDKPGMFHYGDLAVLHRDLAAAGLHVRHEEEMDVAVFEGTPEETVAYVRAFGMTKLLAELPIEGQRVWETAFLRAVEPLRVGTKIRLGGVTRIVVAASTKTTS